MDEWDGRIVIYVPGNDYEDPLLHIAGKWDKDANGNRTLCNRTLRYTMSAPDAQPEERFCAVCARRGDFAAVRAAWSAEREFRQKQRDVQGQQAEVAARRRRPILGRLRADILTHLQRTYGTPYVAPRTDGKLRVNYDGEQFLITIE